MSAGGMHTTVNAKNRIRESLSFYVRINEQAMKAHFKPSAYSAALLIALSVVPTTLAQRCEPTWTLFPGGGTAHTVRALTVFDVDGDGPSAPVLVVGGGFHVIGGVVAPRIAQWDGYTWSPLDAGMDNEVQSLAVFDEDGAGPNPPRLFAGGNFTEAGSQPASRIARWDGASWSPVGAGVNNDGVFALCPADLDGPGPQPESLYVGGNFTIAGGILANRIASWNGSTWSAVGGGVAGPDSIVAAIATFDADGRGPAPSELYVAGGFDYADGVLANNIARWNGRSWASLGSGIEGFLSGVGARAFCVLDDDQEGPNPAMLFVCGTFNTAGGVATGSIAKWDGANWHQVSSGAPITGHITSLFQHDEDATGPLPPRLFVGGASWIISDLDYRAIAAWDGLQWSDVGGGVTSDGSNINAITSFDEDGDGPEPPKLYVAGYFDGIGALYTSGSYNIARWNGIQWLGLGSGIEHTVTAMEVHDPDGSGQAPAALYAGGSFHAVAGNPMPGIAAYVDGEWFPLGEGLAGTVEDLLSFRVDDNPPLLIAGGAFYRSGEDKSIRKVAAWDGASWHSIGGGVSGGTSTSTVHALCLWDPDGSGPQPEYLYVGGEFTHAGGLLVNRIARWDGQSWFKLVNGVDSDVYSLAVYDSDGDGPQPSALHVGGRFGAAGSVAASGIAKWNGTSWSPLGEGLYHFFPFEARAFALSSFDDDGDGPLQPTLWVGGTFAKAGGLTSSNIARWNGSTWIAVEPGANHWVLTLETSAPVDSERESLELIAGGRFEAIGGVSALALARWNGTAWSSFGSVIDEPGNVNATAAFDPDADGPVPPQLFIGGTFASIGGQSCQHFAHWGCPAMVIRGDIDADADVDGFDLALLLGEWTGGSTYSPCPPHTPADLNADCKVNGFDLGILLGSWG